MNRLNKISAIAVMLDIQGTCDGIDNNQVDLFMKQLDFLKNKFEADICYISISTHYRESADIKNILDILSSRLLRGIKIGLSFFKGGTYKYEDDEIVWKDYMFNSNKLKTFEEEYKDSLFLDVKWMAAIDDSFSTDLFSYYKDKYPLLIGRPSQKNYKSYKDNFMSLGTEIDGFMGVLEIMDKYINSIKEMKVEDVFETQKNMMYHLSGSELSNIIRERNFLYLESYLNSGLADETDFVETLMWIGFSLSHQEASKEELVILKRVFDILNQRFIQNDDQININKLIDLERTVSKH